MCSPLKIMMGQMRHFAIYTIRSAKPQPRQDHSCHVIQSVIFTIFEFERFWHIPTQSGTPKTPQAKRSRRIVFNATLFTRSDTPKANRKNQGQSFHSLHSRRKRSHMGRRTTHRPPRRYMLLAANYIMTNFDQHSTSIHQWGDNAYGLHMMTAKAEAKQAWVVVNSSSSTCCEEQERIVRESKSQVEFKG